MMGIIIIKKKLKKLRKRNKDQGRGKGGMTSTMITTTTTTIRCIVRTKPTIDNSNISSRIKEAILIKEGGGGETTTTKIRISTLIDNKEEEEGGEFLDNEIPIHLTTTIRGTEIRIIAIKGEIKE